MLDLLATYGTLCKRTKKYVNESTTKLHFFVPKLDENWEFFLSA